MDKFRLVYLKYVKSLNSDKAFLKEIEQSLMKPKKLVSKSVVDKLTNRTRECLRDIQICIRATNLVDNVYTQEDVINICSSVYNDKIVPLKITLEKHMNI